MNASNADRLVFQNFIQFNKVADSSYSMVKGEIQ